MPSTYSTGRLSRALLIHAGSLAVDLASGSTPSQFADITQLVAAGSGYVAPASPTPAFTAPDAGVVLVSGFDALVIDSQPTVNVQLQVSSANSVAAYRSAAMTGKPVWLMIRTDGYGQASSATVAMQIVQSVLAVLWSDALSFEFSQVLAGFAFLTPDLNVQFSDGSVIDRVFQNTLVQSCWALSRSCMFITSRPADVTGLIAPVVSGSPNSGIPLPNPIIGCSPVTRDCITIVYPNVQNSGFDASVIVGQVAATQVNTNRDSGFSLNMDVAYVISTPESSWVPDGGFGAAPVVPGDVTSLAALFAFLASIGITTFGLQAGTEVPAIQQVLPPDASVNTTSKFQAWSTHGGVITVTYASADGGTVTSTFSATDLSLLSTSST